MEPAFTFDNYLKFFTDPFFSVKVLGTTFWFAVLSTILATLGAYPAAYFLARTKLRIKRFLLVLAASPLFINPVVRTYTWLVALADNGVLNKLCMSLNLIKEPIKYIYTDLGVLIALTQISIPYIILSLLGVLQSIDPTLEEAAKTLGANKVQTFFKITLPLSMPGIVAGSLLVFSLNVSAYAIPRIIGGPRVSMLSLLAYQYGITLGNLPFGSAMSIILLIISITSVLLYTKILSRYYIPVKRV
jgi:putative spermidine/putrescine transport system permease protein